jgi:hypothetical protein
MDWQDAALIVAGLIGSGTAMVHGVLVQRLMVQPLDAMFAERGTPAACRGPAPRWSDWAPLRVRGRRSGRPSL